MLCIICGGTGGARLVRGLNHVYHPVTCICNVGDNIRLLDLAICPDIDTVIYYLAGVADYERGWGLSSETFHCLEHLRFFEPEHWFGLGDRDLATHIWRSHQLRQGLSLSAITDRQAEHYGLRVHMLPATNDWVETHVETSSQMQMHYEEYFVRLRCEPPIRRISYEGIADARPAPGVLEALAEASSIILAPSNPLASIFPIIAIPGIREALIRHRSKVWAISPVIEALALPPGEVVRARSREQLLATLDFPHSSLAVGRLYQEFCTHFVLHEQDSASSAQLEAMGYTVHSLRTDTLTLQHQIELAQSLLQLVENVEAGR